MKKQKKPDFTFSRDQGTLQKEEWEKEYNLNWQDYHDTEWFYDVKEFIRQQRLSAANEASAKTGAAMTLGIIPDAVHNAEQKAYEEGFKDGSLSRDEAVYEEKKQAVEEDRKNRILIITDKKVFDDLRQAEKVLPKGTFAIYAPDGKITIESIKNLPQIKEAVREFADNLKEFIEYNCICYPPNGGYLIEVPETIDTALRKFEE